MDVVKTPYTPLEKQAARAAVRQGMRLRKTGKVYQVVTPNNGTVIEDSGRAPVRFLKALISS